MFLTRKMETERKIGLPTAINYVLLQNLVKDQENIGLEFLEKFNLDIVDVEYFDPKGSQVTMAVRPYSDSQSWKPVTKTSKVEIFYLKNSCL